ncbi:hypothetical protein ACO0QE_001914 [Hanseniaspora vineae]
MSNQIYSAKYSGVEVYELVHPTGSIMKRKKDNWVNATHILKAANFAKAKRTRILERDVIAHQHEKIQGGFGKYQGTWIPLHLAFQLASKYEVVEDLRPLFEFVQLPGAEAPPQAPKHHHASTKNGSAKKSKASTTAATKPISNFNMIAKPLPVPNLDNPLMKKNDSKTPSTESLNSMDGVLPASQYDSRDGSMANSSLTAKNSSGAMTSSGNVQSFNLVASPNSTITAPPSTLTSAYQINPSMATPMGSITSTGTVTTSGKKRGRPPLHKAGNLKKPVTLQRSKSDFQAISSGKLQNKSMNQSSAQTIQLPPIVSKPRGSIGSTLSHQQQQQQQQQQPHTSPLPLLPSTHQVSSFSWQNPNFPLTSSISQFSNGTINLNSSLPSINGGTNNNNNNNPTQSAFINSTNTNNNILGSQPISRMNSFSMMSMIENGQANSAIRPSLTSKKVFSHENNAFNDMTSSGTNGHQFEYSTHDGDFDIKAQQNSSAALHRGNTRLHDASNSHGINGEYYSLNGNSGIVDHMEPLHSESGMWKSRRRSSTEDDTVDLLGSGTENIGENHNDRNLQMLSTLNLNNAYLNEIVNHLIYNTEMPEFLNHTNNKELNYEVINSPIDCEGNTVFHWACALGNVAIVEKLLTNSEVNIYLMNQAGENGLLRSVLFHNCYTNSTDCFQKLLELIGNELITSRNNNGQNILHYIVTKKSDSPSAVLYMEKTLEYLSSTSSNKNKMKLLINQQDYSNGDTPLHIASSNQDDIFYKTLLNKGCNVNIKNMKNKSPIYESGIVPPPPTSDFANGEQNEDSEATDSNATFTGDQPKFRISVEQNNVQKSKTVAFIYKFFLPELNKEVNKLSQVYYQNLKDKSFRNNELHKIIESIEKNITNMERKFFADETHKDRFTDAVHGQRIGDELLKLSHKYKGLKRSFGKTRRTLLEVLEKQESFFLTKRIGKLRDFDALGNKTSSTSKKDLLKESILITMKQLKRKKILLATADLYTEGTTQDKFFKYRKMISKGSDLDISEIDDCLDEILQTISGSAS